MKNYLYILLLFTASSLLAQTPTKHSFILGGNGQLGFSFKNDESDASTFTIALQPNFGYMITEKWSLHGSIGFVYNYINIVNLQDKKRYIYNKMYFFISDKFGIYIEPQVIYNVKVTDKQNIDGNRKNQLKYQKQYSVSIGTEPGLIFFPRNDISIDCSIGGIGYSLDVEKWPAHTKLKHSFNTFIQPVGVSIGIRKYFIPRS
jgi:hypothetical protein